jgi:phospholipase/lecithinase/hemolysin
LLKGLDYAQGGARVTNVIGYGVEKGYSARPVIEQLLYFVQEHKKFDSEDLVLIQGGANDIFVLLGEVSQGKKTPEQVVKDSVQAAMELAALVKKIIALGAKNVYVQNLPQVEKTPKIILLDPKVQKLVEQMVFILTKH